MSIKIFKLDTTSISEYFSICADRRSKRPSLASCEKNRVEWIYEQSRKGLIIKNAFEYGNIVGQITALPLNNSPIGIRGEGYWYIPCVWMLPHYAKPKLSELLIESIIDDLDDKCKGIVTLSNSAWMNHTTFLESLGFSHWGSTTIVGKKSSIMVLSFTDSPGDKSYDLKIILRKPPASSRPQLDFFHSPHCPAQTDLAYNIVKEHKDLPMNIELKEYDSSKPRVVDRYGYSLALLYKGKHDILKDYIKGKSLEEIILSKGELST